jgi:hypothetical protein
MLNRVTWGNYWILVFVLLAVYYLYVFLTFFKKGFFSRPSINRASKGIKREPAGNPGTDLFSDEKVQRDPAIQNIQQDEDNDNIYMPLVHELTQEVKNFIVNKSKRSYVKEEIVLGIKAIVEEYLSLADTPFYKPLNDFFRFECEATCNIIIDENDIRMIWFA